MPKVLHINCATSGSTGKIIGDIADYSTPKGYTHILCAPGVPGNNENVRYYRTSLPYEQGLYRRISYMTGFQYGLAPLSTAKIKSIIKKEKPDLIHVHCLNGMMVNVYQLFAFLQKQKLPTAITNHAEFLYTGSCAHAYDCQKWLTGCGSCPQGYAATGRKRGDNSAAAWQKMKNAFDGFENAMMISVSPWVGSRAARSPITEKLPQAVVLNGVNIDTFTYRQAEQLRQQHGIDPAAKILFHPTANFSDSPQDPKGGRYILELARQMEGQNVVFLVAGKYAQGLSVPKNVILLGRIADQMLLAQYYALADVTVVAGKRETFNLPVAESLCCGTPVAGFLAGGPESIAMEQYCLFAEHGDVQALQSNVRQLLLRQPDKENISRQAKEKYAAAVMAQGYLDCYEQLLTKGDV